MPSRYDGWPLLHGHVLHGALAIGRADFEQVATLGQVRQQRCRLAQLAAARGQLAAQRIAHGEGHGCVRAVAGRQHEWSLRQWIGESREAPTAAARLGRVASSEASREYTALFTTE